MKSPLFTPYILVLLGMFAQPAVAIETFSPEAALQKAMDQSPELQKMEAQKDEARWKKIEGFSTFLPTISLNANHFFEKKYELLDITFSGNPVEIPQIFPSSSATLEAKWFFFDGFMNVNTFRAGSSFQAAADADFEWAHFQLDHDVKLAYAKVVSAKKLADVADQNVKTLQNHLGQVKNLKTGGLATNYDVLRVEAQLSEAQAELMLTKDNIQIAQEKLGQILGLTEPADVSGSDLAVPSTEAIQSLTFGPEKVQKRLDLQALQSRVDSTDLMVTAHKAFWVPKIGLDAQYIKYNNLSDSLSDWEKYRPAWSVGFILTWELFNAGLYSKAKQEAYRAVQSQKTLIQANLQAPVDFAFWKKRYLYSASLYEAKKADLERAQETVRLADAGFKAGVRTTTEVLDAELDLFRARAGIVNTQMNCIEAKIKLELSTGEKL